MIVRRRILDSRKTARSHATLALGRSTSPMLKLTPSPAPSAQCCAVRTQSGAVIVVVQVSRPSTNSRAAHGALSTSRPSMMSGRTSGGGGSAWAGVVNAAVAGAAPLRREFGRAHADLLRFGRARPVRTENRLFTRSYDDARGPITTRRF